MKTVMTLCASLALLTACGSASPVPDREARIQAANDVLLNQGRVDQVTAFFLPTYVLHTQDGDATGPEVISGGVSALRAAFPDLRVEVEVLATDDDRAAWLRTHRGTHEGDFMGVPATGRPIVWQTMVVTRYEGDMIAEEWGVSDLGARLRME